MLVKFFIINNKMFFTLKFFRFIKNLLYALLKKLKHNGTVCLYSYIRQAKVTKYFIIKSLFFIIRKPFDLLNEGLYFFVPMSDKNLELSFPWTLIIFLVLQWYSLNWLYKYNRQGYFILAQNLCWIREV